MADNARIQRVGDLIGAKATLLVGSPFFMTWAKGSQELREACRNWKTISATMTIPGYSQDAIAGYKLDDFAGSIFGPRVYQAWHNPAQVFESLHFQLSKLANIPNFALLVAEIDALSKPIAALAIAQWSTYPDFGTPFIQIYPDAPSSIRIQLPETKLRDSLKPVIGYMQAIQKTAGSLRSTLEEVLRQGPPIGDTEWTLDQAKRTVGDCVNIPQPGSLYSLDKWLTELWPQMQREIGDADMRVEGAFDAIVNTHIRITTYYSGAAVVQGLKDNGIDFGKDKLDQVLSNAKTAAIMDTEFKSHAEAVKALFGFPEISVRVGLLSYKRYYGSATDPKPSKGPTTATSLLAYCKEVYQAYALFEWILADKKRRQEQPSTLNWPYLAPRVNEFYVYLVSIRNVMQAVNVDLIKLWSFLDSLHANISDVETAAQDAILNAQAASFDNTVRDMYQTNNALRQCSRLQTDFNESSFRTLNKTLWEDQMFVYSDAGATPTCESWANPRLSAAVSSIK